MIMMASITVTYIVCRPSRSSTPPMASIMHMDKASDMAMPRLMEPRILPSNMEAMLNLGS